MHLGSFINFTNSCFDISLAFLKIHISPVAASNITNQPFHERSFSLICETAARTSWLRCASYSLTVLKLAISELRKTNSLFRALCFWLAEMSIILWRRTRDTMASRVFKRWSRQGPSHLLSGPVISWLAIKTLDKKRVKSVLYLDTLMGYWAGLKVLIEFENTHFSPLLIARLDPQNKAKTIEFQSSLREIL